MLCAHLYICTNIPEYMIAQPERNVGQNHRSFTTEEIV